MSPYPAQANASALADHLEQRRDPRQRDIVARGVALRHESGTLCAVEFLKRHAVRPQVIERVLLDPARGATA